MSNILKEFGISETCPPCPTTTTTTTTAAFRQCIPVEWPSQEIILRFGLGLMLMILFLFIIGLSLTKIFSECRKKRDKAKDEESFSCSGHCINLHENLSQVTNHVEGLSAKHRIPSKNFN